MRFRRTRSGIEAKVDRAEAQVLVHLLDELLDLLGEDEGGDPLEALVGITSEPVERPQDPALARLFPDAYPSDDEAAQEFRRFTQRDLQEGKRTAAGRMRAALTTADRKVSLDDEEAEAWLGALNDLRLTLGTRLDVTEETDLSELDADDPRTYPLAVYSWLGYVQETLVDAVSRS